MTIRKNFGPLKEADVTSMVGQPEGPIVADVAGKPNCIGYWYKCGCEIRGSGPFYAWIPCEEHYDEYESEFGERDVSAAYAGGKKITNKQAREELGWPT